MKNLRRILAMVVTVSMLLTMGVPAISEEAETSVPGQETILPNGQTDDSLDTIPGDTILGDTIPGDTIPGDTVPGDTAPGDTAPGDTVPGDTEPADEDLEGDQPAEKDPEPVKVDLIIKLNGSETVEYDGLEHKLVPEYELTLHSEDQQYADLIKVAIEPIVATNAGTYVLDKKMVSVSSADESQVVIGSVFVIGSAQLVINGMAVTVEVTSNANLTVFSGQEENTAYKSAYRILNAEGEEISGIGGELVRVIPSGMTGTELGRYEYAFRCADGTLVEAGKPGAVVADNYSVTLKNDRGYAYRIKMPVELGLKDGAPSKVFGQSDADVDFSSYVTVKLPEGCTEADVSAALEALRPMVVRTGAGTEEKEHAGKYGYEEFTIRFTDSDFYEAKVSIDAPGFGFTIEPLDVTLTMKGEASKLYGQPDADADFGSFVTAELPEGYSGIPAGDVLAALKPVVTRIGAGTAEKERVGVYGYGDFEIAFTGNGDYNAVVATEAPDFSFTIGKLAVTLSLAGHPSKTYGQADVDFSSFVTAALPEGYTGAQASEVLAAIRPVVTRTGAGAEEKERAGKYGYEDFQISFTENSNYAVKVAEAATDFDFTIKVLSVTLSMEGKPEKTYGVSDDDAELKFIDYVTAEYDAENNGKTREDIIDELKVAVTRIGVGTDEKEHAGEYGYADFQISYEEDNSNYAVTVRDAAPDFLFTIKPLPVTLSLSGKLEKDYGVSDEDAGLDFDKYLTISIDKESGKDADDVRAELGITVTRPDAGSIDAGELVGTYGIDSFAIDYDADNADYDVTVAETAEDFAFTIRNNVTIGSVVWTEGAVTTRTGNDIKVSFTVPAGCPDVTLDVPMTVTAKLDLTNADTSYLTDAAKTALEALLLEGEFTGTNGTITIPAPDAMQKYYIAGVDAWQGGLPVGTTLEITGVQMNDAPGTVNGEAAPALPVEGFEVARHKVELSVSVAAEGTTMFVRESGEYVVGPAAVLSISHNSRLPELVNVAGKIISLNPNETYTLKGSDLEALGVGTCEDGSKADAFTTLTIKMVDDVHLAANAWSEEIVLDNVPIAVASAEFENRGKEIKVVLKEKPQEGSVKVTIAGIEGEQVLSVAESNGEFVATLDVFDKWKDNTDSLIRSGTPILVTYTDAVGNVCTAQPSGSVKQSTGKPIKINMSTVEDNSDGTLGSGKVKIYGEASNWENVIVSVGDKSYPAIPVSGSGSYDTEKVGQWETTIDLSALNLDTGKVTVRVEYEDLVGSAERTFNYKAEVMPVLLTSPNLANFDKLYGFAEYGTTVHVTINGEDYSTRKNPEMFLTGDAGNTVSVYAYFPNDADSYFYWIFQSPIRLTADDEVYVWYMDFTGSNASKEKLKVTVADNERFQTEAEMLGANVIDYVSVGEDGTPGTGEMAHHYVTPVDLSALREGATMELPVMAYTGYEIGKVSISMNANGQLVVNPVISDDGAAGSASCGIRLFATKPSIEDLAANSCTEAVETKTFNVGFYGDVVWVSARFTVELDYLRIGKMEGFCALTPYDAESDNSLQRYAKSFSAYYDDYSSFLDKTDSVSAPAETNAAA